VSKLLRDSFNPMTISLCSTSFPSRTMVATALAAAVLATGCASGPDYHAPMTPDTAVGLFVSRIAASDTRIAAADTRIAAADTNAPMPVDWWKLYENPTLNSLVQDALSANTSLRMAQANLARARAIFGEARSGLFPSTTASAGASYGRDQTSWTGSGQAPKQWSYSGGLDISYEVDIFGRVQRDIEAAHYDTDAVAAAFDATRVVVVAETTRAYVDACTLGEAIEVADSSIALAQRSLGIIVSQERAGSGSHLDVERAGVILAQAQAALPALQGQREFALFELAALTGRTPAQVPDAARACTKAPEIVSALPVGDGSALLRRRPDVRQAERRLAADTARIGVAVADLYPKVSLGASANYLRNDFLKGDRTFSFALGPLISWSFPNVMVARSRVEQAKAQTAASLASFDGTVLNALKESEQSLSTYGSALLQRNALIEARTRAENAFRLADQRFRSGSISYLDVIVAQTSFINARSQVAAADQRVGSARVSVFKALGGGWEGEDVQ